MRPALVAVAALAAGSGVAFMTAASPLERGSVLPVDSWKQATQCEYGAWSPVRQVAHLPPGDRLHDISIVTLRDRVVFAGTLVTPRENAGWLVKPEPLFVVDDSGRVLGRPDGGYRFLAPRMAADLSGQLHLLWGESGGSGAQTFPNHTSVPASAILQSSYVPDRGWQDAERVWGETDREKMFAFPFWDNMDGGDVRGNVRVSPTIEVDPSRLAIWFANRSLVVSPDGALTTAMEGFRGGISLLRRNSGEAGWRVEPGIDGRDPELVSGRNGELWMAYRTSNPRELRVIASSDGGASWHQSAVVQQLTNATANHPRLLYGPDGLLHLLWSHGFGRGELSSAIRHSFSQDGGRTWSAPSTFPYPGSFTNWDAAVDQCGGVHLVYANEGSVWHARWSAEWNPASLIYAGQAPFNSPAVTISDLTGTLHLAGNIATQASTDSVIRFALVEMRMPVSKRLR